MYLRSSKDRADVSIAVQRSALVELAKTKGLPVVGEYADAVESGKDDQRPAYQGLLRDLTSRDRTWSVILAYDTSRIARRTFIAQTLSHEAKKRGVSILYVKVPETDPITTVILENVLQAMDEVHSLMSREKGLAGMAENVRRGFRAGGRAPVGYRLDPVTTDVMREGAPVMKSRLVPGPEAEEIANYLRARAAGMHGTTAQKKYGVSISRSGLVDVEWNALTYAGHTVWNMRRAKEQQEGGARRPRAEWTIQRNTHQALITDDEAEAILSRLESRAQGGTRRRGSDYVLSGLLQNDAGKNWHGDGATYRIKGGAVNAQELEQAVLTQIASDFRSPEIVAAYIRELGAFQKSMAEYVDVGAALRDLRDVEGKIGRLTALLDQTTEPAPLVRRIEELEKDRRTATDRLARAQDEQEKSSATKAITSEDVHQALDRLAADLAALDRDTLKDSLRQWLSKVEFDPATRSGRIHYRLTLDGVKAASPPRFELGLSP